MLYEVITAIQIVHGINSGIVPELLTKDLTQLSKEGQKKEIYNCLEADLENKYKMHNDLLWRLYSFKLDTNNYCFVLSCQHAILDGWSIASLMSELFDIYNKMLSGEEIQISMLKSSYKEYVALGLGRKSSEDIQGFWREKLAGYNVITSYSIHYTKLYEHSSY